ncbi:MAG: hypothetical protein FWF59_00350 [Turicibacter sp.]|nr:hypothetical protein [Turicibacter sp.]
MTLIGLGDETGENYGGILKLLDTLLRNRHDEVKRSGFIARQIDERKKMAIAQNLLDVLNHETIAKKVYLDLSVVKKLRKKSLGR